MRRIIFLLFISLLIGGCNDAEPHEEIKDFFEATTVEESYDELLQEEQKPVSEALQEISFAPKQLNEETLPFTVKKKMARVTETEDNSQMIQLGYGGTEHMIDLIVENSLEIKKEPSLQYEEVILENGRTALYAEDEKAHYVTWMEKEINYLMVLIYKSGTGETPEKFDKEAVIKIVNEVE